MEEKKNDRNGFSFCFEGSAFAEAMQRIAGQGTGSDCGEMMRSMMKKCCTIRKNREESHVEE